MLRRSNKFMALISALTLAGLMLAACGPAATSAPTTAPTAVPPTQAPPTQAPPTVAPTEAPTEAPTTVPVVEIKIAMFAPLTGPAASLGQEQLAFARQAVIDFNKTMTGFHATMVEEDTDITADKAVPVCTKDAADNTIVGVVGPSGSGQVEACAKILEDAGLGHVTPSATKPSLSQGGNKTFFRVVPNDDVQGPTDGNYIADKLGAKNVYVIDDKESYGTNLADTVEKVLKSKGVTTKRDGVDQKLNDFSSLATTIKAFKPDLVFFAGQVSSQGAALAKAMKDQGLSVPIFGGDGFFSQKDFIDGAGGATEGSYCSVFFPDLRSIPAAADVAKEMDAAFPAWGPFGAPTYVATTILLNAAVTASQAGKLDRAGVVAALANTDTKIFGIEFKFDATGEPSGLSDGVFQVKGGKFVGAP
jgi:branched-chain amino acid transport system substrate-binding protein